MTLKAYIFAVTLVLVAVIAPSLQAQYPAMPYGQPGMYGPGSPAMMAMGPSGIPLNAAASLGMTPHQMVAQAGHTVPVAALGKGDGCDGKCDGAGGKGCGACGPRLAFYGEFLYLRPRSAEVAYAAEVDGPIAAPPAAFPLQISPVGVADLDFQPGFRAGFRYHVNEYNAVGAEYTFFEGNTFNQVFTQPLDVIRSLVSHPGSQTAAQDFLEASARNELSHDILDVNFYNQFWCERDLVMSWVAGVRVVQHEQNFQALFAGTGTETVVTDVDFYGAGARLGLEIDKYLTCQWLVYARGYGGLLPGEFRADYDQNQSYDADVVNTGWKGGRLVTTWDLELGSSWMSKCGYYRFNLGYVFSAWTNMVQTDEWIKAVQQNNFVGLDSTMTYDGLVARVEARY